MAKICLGSANFGSRYGLKNKALNYYDIKELINIAKKKIY